MTASRSFRVPCRNAQEFAFRQMGRYYEAGLYEGSMAAGGVPMGLGRQHRNATHGGDRLRHHAGCRMLLPCGTERRDTVAGQHRVRSTMERYYYTDAEVGEGASNSECDCLVRIDYANPPWNCVDTDFEIGTLLNHTAIRVRRTSGYELFTVPTRSLVGGQNWFQPHRFQFQSKAKGDSNATILIPKQTSPLSGTTSQHGICVRLVYIWMRFETQ